MVWALESLGFVVWALGLRFWIRGFIASGWGFRLLGWSARVLLKTQRPTGKTHVAQTLRATVQHQKQALNPKP